MKRTIITIILLVAFIVPLTIFDIKMIENESIKTLWSNLYLISSSFIKILPLLLLLLLVICLALKKWSIQVKEISIGGFTMLFETPHNLFRSRIRNYLNTKRTIFLIDLENDNFIETFDSYYAIYIFFREEIQLLEKRKPRKTKRKDNKDDLYELGIEAISKLNLFLTKYQSNYRRWYAYFEKGTKSSSKIDSFYLNPIGEFQASYKKYDELCEGFIDINKFFKSKIAIEFDIDIERWER